MCTSVHKCVLETGQKQSIASEFETIVKHGEEVYHGRELQEISWDTANALFFTLRCRYMDVSTDGNLLSGYIMTYASVCMGVCV